MKPEILSETPITMAQLKEELDRWGLFEEYEDRFLALFRRK
jgi:hypothetical protein